MLIGMIIFFIWVVIDSLLELYSYPSKVVIGHTFDFYLPFGAILGFLMMPAMEYIAKQFVKEISDRCFACILYTGCVVSVVCSFLCVSIHKASYEKTLFEKGYQICEKKVHSGRSVSHVYVKQATLCPL